jgi:ceramide glucosyltransferase
VLTILFSGAAPWSVGAFGIVWVARAVAGLGVDRALAPGWAGNAGAGLAFCCPVWLLPLRDAMSLAVMLASYAGRKVDWRGHEMHADTPMRTPAPFSPIEGTRTP